MTISEQLFERFCQAGVIPFVRLPTGDDRTPDYKIEMSGTQMIVEIKELTPNDDEQRAIREFQENHSTTCGWTLGNRVRYKIDSAKGQLERLAGGECPGILLLYDARPEPFHGIEPVDIMAAMYGCEAIDVHIPDDPGEPVRFGAHRFGKGKKLRHDCHTFISAIGSLWERHADGHIHIDFFNNVHATHPIPFATIVQRKDMTVYTLAPGRGNEHRRWAKMVMDEEYKETNQASHGGQRT
jgi:hypothetical protein